MKQLLLTAILCCMALAAGAQKAGSPNRKLSIKTDGDKLVICHNKKQMLALTVLFESGLQHLADRPESFLAQPQEVQTFLGQLPTVWDETRLVNGYPGESAVLARRSGGTWYVAGINGKDEPQTLATNLRFIGKGSIQMFADDAEGNWLISNPQKLPSEVSCQPRGGFVLVVSPNP